MKWTSRLSRSSLATATRTTAPTGLREGSRELGPAIKSVRAFAGFHLDVLGDGIEPVRLGEMGEGLTLRFNAEPALTLLRGADPDVAHQCGHDTFPLCEIGFLQMNFSDRT
jgi:hypothetical protein